jgi:transcription initiation factor TFIID TATA-box-binding protein
MAVWRPFSKNSVTFLIPSTGRIIIVGAKRQKELFDGIDKMYDKLEPYVDYMVPHEEFLNEFQVNNIAAKGSLDRELDLPVVAVSLGLEKTEYEPEQFQGIVYRPLPGVVTLIFRTGSVIITASSYPSVIDGWEKLCRDLSEIGVNL